MPATYRFMLLVGVVSLGSGFLLGSRNAPVAVDSQLAEAQVVAQDRDVRWVAYDCGEDHATYITREMPSIAECKTVQRLRDDLEFPAPPRA